MVAKKVAERGCEGEQCIKPFGADSVWSKSVSDEDDVVIFSKDRRCPLTGESGPSTRVDSKLVPPDQ